MATFRAAVIGLGRIASTIDDEIERYDGVELPYSHIACYRAVPEIELAGLADTWEEQREAARARWAVDAVFADYREMLRETRPDIVSVCTSTRPRAEILLELATGGYGLRAIWAEKPLSMSLEDADRVIQACQQAGIVLAVNCLRRWRDIYRQALTMIADGLIGDVTHVQALGECSLSHNGSHLLTTLTMFAGARAEWVMGEAQLDDRAPDNDFAGAGYVGFANGVRGYFRSFANGPNDWSFDITGTTGMIRIMQDGGSVEHWTLEDSPAGKRRRTPVRRFFPLPSGSRSAGVNAVYDIMACIETPAVPKCSGTDALEALEIAIATRESHKRGGSRVDLPIKDRSLRIIPAEVIGGDLPRAVMRRRAGA